LEELIKKIEQNGGMISFTDFNFEYFEDCNNFESCDELENTLFDFDCH